MSEFCFLFRSVFFLLSLSLSPPLPVSSLKPKKINAPRREKKQERLPKLCEKNSALLQTYFCCARVVKVSVSVR